MIANNKEYKITKTHIRNFQQSLDELLSLSEAPDNIHPIILEAQKNALVSTLLELKMEVNKYKAKKKISILNDIYFILTSAGVVIGAALILHPDKRLVLFTFVSIVIMHYYNKYVLKKIKK